MTAIVGVALTLALWSRMTAREEATAQEIFRVEAEVLRLNVEQEFLLFAEVLDSIRVLHGLSGEIRPEAFAEFVEKGMVHQAQVLGAFGFAQRISHTLRIALEEAYAETPDLGYLIVGRGPDKTWPPAEPRAEYFPVTWQHAPASLGVPNGFDLSSDPAARSAIERMRRSGRAALVPEPLDLAHDRRHWVFSPIFHTPAPTDAREPTVHILIGCAIGLLHPENVLARAASMTAPSPGIRLDLAPAQGAGRQGERDITRVRGEWIYQHPIDVMDTRWNFQCRLPVSVPGRRSGAVLIAGLLITALMTSQLVLIAGRTRRIEDEVRARTDDLRTAKGQLEVEMQERARLEEEMADLASKERQRLGRDLHDSLGQKLTGAVFLSRSLLSHLREEGGGEESHAQTLNDTLKEAVGQVRAMAKGLAPVTLSDENLGEALASLAEEMTDVYGVSCEVGELAADTNLFAKEKEQLYLIAREAANNAARHAQARKIVMALRSGPDGVELSVEDDGKGMPADAESLDGMGLRIMRHRARMLGGSLQVEPGTNGGTRVACVMSARRDA